MTLQAIVIEWDGTHVPKGLRELPPGQYLVSVVDDDVTDLTPEEDAGIRAALDDLEAGHFVPYEEAMRELRAGLDAE